MTNSRAVWGVLLLAASASSSAAEVKLRILETTDVHMNLLSYDYYQDKVTDQYGLARSITLIKAARAEAPNSLLSGDLIEDDQAISAFGAVPFGHGPPFNLHCCQIDRACGPMPSQ